MVKVLFFGMLSAKTGTKVATVELEKDQTLLSEVISEIRSRYPELPEGPFIYAINEEQAAPDAPVKDGDEIAIMPPFAGG
ncbi:hypothetical protein MNBD_DELTA02-1144 [hydrothermal vent metagenome]|uniref:Molybdopterin synthase sulfur carrier subunit n=1 Tax=hydrothermal vent metagenome TaxID=652676 RepID=A0A3B0UXP4_9ZZZZ